jgi:hypothetical protein
MAYYDASYRHGVRPPRLHHLALYLASQQVPNHLLPSQAHGVIERQEVDGGEEGVEETEGQHERDPAWWVSRVATDRETSQGVLEMSELRL